MRQTYFAVSAEAGRVTLSYASPIDRLSVDSGADKPAAKRRRLVDSAWAPAQEPGHSPNSQRCGCAACTRPKSRLESLPSELLDRIAQSLPPNEVACTLRLLSRSLAAHFRSHTAVRLSQPVPHHDFVRRFGSWSAVRSLPLFQRRQLLALTAASGSVANLRVVAGGPGVTRAVGTAGCALTDEVFTAAAAAGQMRTAAAASGDPAVVEALIDLHEAGHTYVGGGWDDGGSECESEEAASADEGDSEDGNTGGCEAASDADKDGGEAAAGLVPPQLAHQHRAVEATAAAGAAAAGGGGGAGAGAATDAASPDAAARAAALAVDMAALRGLRPMQGILRFPALDFVEACAYGLPLQPMAAYAVRCGVVGPNGSGQGLSHAVAAALLSPTPDWRAKAEWLESQCADAAGARADATGLADRTGLGEPLPRRVLYWIGAMPADKGPRHPADGTLPPLNALLSPEQLLERLAWARRRDYSVTVPPVEVLPLSDAAAMRAILEWVLQDPQQVLGDRGFGSWSYFLAVGAARGGHTATLQALALEQQRALAAAAGQAVVEGGGLSASSGSRRPAGQQAGDAQAEERLQQGAGLQGASNSNSSNAGEESAAGAAAWRPRHATGDSGLDVYDWWLLHGLGGFEQEKALAAAVEGGNVQLCERLRVLGHALRLLQELWERLEEWDAWHRPGRMSVCDMAHELRDAVCKRWRSSGAASRCASLPLIDFVLRNTSVGADWEDEYMHSWGKVSGYEVSQELPDGSSLSVTAAVFDDWVGRLRARFDEWQEVARLAEGMATCHHTRLAKQREEQASGGRKGRGGRGATAALVSRNVAAAWELMAASERACWGRMRRMVAEVMVWDPCEAGEDEEESSVEEQ
ncbi:hypothetical protein HXX76_012465 [Chlamydomonas incerta]|uniref:F-box domain-containing protein n=1 Tax=Chlamydomonas incerta TaxID=51695 RepID=A0A835SHU8_CHLIN|nr:hypothetical protein HXX76_012465 [Chlamydomonas incerta]|eukprot:KAG2427269.1 hypothetical protein HXX76_012465 [Chlamydomonas incerta]